MGIVGMQLNKIVVEKHSPVKGKINVNNNVTIKDVEKTELQVGPAKQSAIKFHFEYSAMYEPKIAHVTLNGYVTFFDTPDKVKEITDDWKKNKKMPKEILSSVLNTVMSRCNVSALFFAREVNLPPPINLPKVQVK